MVYVSTGNLNSLAKRNICSSLLKPCSQLKNSLLSMLCLKPCLAEGQRASFHEPKPFQKAAHRSIEWAAKGQVCRNNTIIHCLGGMGDSRKFLPPFLDTDLSEEISISDL